MYRFNNNKNTIKYKIFQKNNSVRIFCDEFVKNNEFNFKIKFNNKEIKLVIIRYNGLSKKYNRN